jgi:hypothetical protein
MFKSVVVGKYLYLVPYKSVDSSSADQLFGYSGKVVRIDLETFDGYRSVKVLDLTMVLKKESRTHIHVVVVVVVVITNCEFVCIF